MAEGTAPPMEDLVQGVRPLYIEPVTLTRWMWIFKGFMANGIALTIVSLPLLAQLGTLNRDSISTRKLGPLFLVVGLYFLFVGALAHRVLKDYRAYIYGLAVDAGDSNFGAYVRSPELFRSGRSSRRVSRQVVPGLHIPTSLPAPLGPSTPYGPNETNFVEIMEPYASFQSMGIPPPPYRP